MRNTTKGNLYTTYFSSGKSQGLKLAVVRYKPKWLDFNEHKIVHMIELSPYESQLNGYNKGDIEWEEFSEVFIEQLQQENSTSHALGNVQRALDKGSDVTLMCYEKDSSKCHRSLLGEYFSELGYEVEEL